MFWFDSPLALSATLHEFTADDLGYSVHWRFRVTMRLVQGAVERLSRTFNIKKHTGKFISLKALMRTIDELIRESYETFFGDPEVQMLMKSL